MKPAPCSWRVSTKRMRPSRSIASISVMFSSPGMPKITSTPSFTRHSTMRSAVFLRRSATSESAGSAFTSAFASVAGSSSVVLASSNVPPHMCPVHRQSLFRTHTQRAWQYLAMPGNALVMAMRLSLRIPRTVVGIRRLQSFIMSIAVSFHNDHLHHMTVIHCDLAHIALHVHRAAGARFTDWSQDCQLLPCFPHRSIEIGRSY